MSRHDGGQARVEKLNAGLPSRRGSHPSFVRSARASLLQSSTAGSSEPSSRPTADDQVNLGALIELRVWRRLLRQDSSLLPQQ
jgi:hypothetical protein